FDSVQATGVRLIVPVTGIAGGTAIDEIEVYDQVSVAPGDALFEFIAHDAYHEHAEGDDVGFGYQVDKVFSDGKTGFYGLGLTSATANPILVLRGTEPTQWTDVVADFDQQGIGFRQFDQNKSGV